MQSFTIAICVLLKMSTFCVVSYYLSAKASPEWSLSLGFRTQKKLCPFNRGNRYRNYGGVFPGPNFLSPEWRCPLNIGDPKERFHCSEVREREKKKRRERGRALASYPSPSLGTIWTSGTVNRLVKSSTFPTATPTLKKKFKDAFLKQEIMWSFLLFIFR